MEHTRRLQEACARGQRTASLPLPAQRATPGPASAPPAAIGMRSPVENRLAAERMPGAPDYVLLGTIVALLLFGLVMVYSASQYAVAGDPGYWFRRQLLSAILGSGIMFVTANVEYSRWRKHALPGIGIAVVLLFAVLLLGRTAFGARRWLSIAGMSFQPSELTKLVLAIYIAEWLVHRGKNVRSARDGLLPFALFTGFILALILKQNDLGTTFVVAAIALAMFFAAGASLFQLVPTLVLGLGVALALAAQDGFRRARLDTFIHPLPPNCEPQSAYQVCQGLISLGSGGMFGVGLGNSIQKAGYLPSAFTDSIFAIIGNELGLFGCLFLLALFGLLAWRGLRAAQHATEPFGALLACGITAWLVTQAVVNVGSVVDAIPFTGVPLPFVSFGGSSLVISMAATGILLNISRDRSPHIAE